MARGALSLLFVLGAAAVCLGVPGSSGAGRAASGWAARDLGTLGGGYSRALAVDARGDVAGTSKTADGTRYAFSWHDGTMKRIGGLLRDEVEYGYREVVLNDVGQILVDQRLWQDGHLVSGAPSPAVVSNDRGQVAGQARRGGGLVVWQAGRTQRVEGLGAGPRAGAVAINDRGELLVGLSADSGSPERAFEALRAVLWRNGRVTDLGRLDLAGAGWGAVGYGPYVAPYALNELGQVAAIRASRGGRHDKAVLWSAGETTVLAVPGYPSAPLLLNDHAEVVINEGSDFGSRAYLWRHGKATLLPEIHAKPVNGQLGGHGTWAEMIDDQGRIVGASNGHAFVWQHGAMIDLGPGKAFAINERGDIVGYRNTGAPGAHGSVPPYHATLWIPR